MVEIRRPGQAQPQYGKAGAGFKPCSECPSPGRCKAAGACLAKGR